MRIVVTGATSFLGAVTVRQLLEKGYQVDAIVRPDSRNMANLYKQVPKNCESNLQIMECNLSDIMKISDFISGADAWIHMGWDGSGSENRKKREIQQENVVQSVNAVHAAAKLGCKRFLFTGSQAEYGVCNTVITEENPLNPVSEYGIAKVEFGQQAKVLCENYGMDYIHTRIFSVYGPGDHPHSLVESCIRTWMEDGTMKLGECTQKWNYLYIEDAVSALISLLEKAEPGIYNIASTDVRVLRDYIKEMYELCGNRGSYVFGERPQNAEGPANLVADISKICDMTGWHPVTTFSEGIHELLHRMREDAS